MKYFTAVLFSISMVSAVSAEQLTPQQALSRLNRQGVNRVVSQEKRLKLVDAVDHVYVFSSGSGFVLLPDDDCAPALLGYADAGVFDAEVNPALKWWIGEYGRQIEYAIAAGAELRGTETDAGRGPIANLCKTVWNQEAPYDGDCPMLDGRRCVTGCVATAMAQVMKVFNYPVSGIGTHSYHWAAGDTTLTFDYGSTVFDWANMTDKYDSKSTEAQKSAVAKLMYACGVSVNMIYHPGESGAYSQSMGPAMLNLFGYDKGGWMPYRDYYDLDTWEGMIYDNLAQGMPVLYTGTGSDGGHQFVCDGYNTDGYFHFNWGWGGLSDGYFLLTALEPSALGVGGGDGGFDYQQAASLGIRPPVDGSQPHYLLYCTSGITSVPMKYKLGAAAFFKGHYTNESYTAMPDGSMLGMSIIPKDGGDTINLQGRTLAGLGAGSGIGGLTVALPSLAEGEYTLQPAMVLNGEWTPVLSPMSGNPSFLGIVRGDSIYLSTPDKAIISGDSLRLESELIWGKPFRFTLNAINTGTREYIGNIIPELLNATGDSIVARGVKQPIDVPAGDSVPVTYTGTWTLNSAYSKTDPAPGSFKMRVTDAQGVLMGDTLDVTLTAAPAKTTIAISDLRLGTQDPSSVRNNVPFHFIAKCTEGYWAGNIQVLIFPGSGGEWLVSGETGDVFLAEGESAECQVHVDMSTLSNGEYIACCDAGGLKGNQLYFRLDVVTGVDEQSEDVSERVFYNLDGIRVDNPIPGNIYIVVSTRGVVKELYK